jgi:predicted AAA+ superfamily ATPase
VNNLKESLHQMRITLIWFCDDLGFSSARGGFQLRRSVLLNKITGKRPTKTKASEGIAASPNRSSRAN